MGLNSSTTSPWDDGLANQYNDLRKDVIEKAGDRVVTTWSANAYVITTDAQITAYVVGQRYPFEASFTNTWSATWNVNTIWAKTIKDITGATMTPWLIVSWGTYEVMYDGTDLIFLWPAKASDSDALWWTDDAKYITPKQAKDNYKFVSWVEVFTRDLAAAAWTVVIPHSLWKIPKTIMFTWGQSAGAEFTSSGTWDGTNNKWIELTVTGILLTSKVMKFESTGGNFQDVSVTAATASDYTLTRTKTWSPSGIMKIVSTLFA